MLNTNLVDQMNNLNGQSLIDFFKSYFDQNQCSNSAKGSWFSKLSDEINRPYMLKLFDFLKTEYSDQKKIYPSVENYFRSLQLCPFDKTKVIILGQDPYHGEGQAHGLSFSVPEGVALPPSLKNIFKELQSDMNLNSNSSLDMELVSKSKSNSNSKSKSNSNSKSKSNPNSISISHSNSSFVRSESGDLSSWAEQGVLLLNSTLTVEKSKPGSHQNRGWEMFTDHILKVLSQDLRPKVFILWGASAQKKITVIDPSYHLILQSPHPSPLSSYRGFFGSRPFSKANEFLIQTRQTPINWSLK